MQWMPQDEMDIWRALLAGQHPIEYVVIATLTRVETDPAHRRLIPSAIDLHIETFPESGVAEYIQACLPTTVENLPTLASFLYAETGGSPLYLRSLIGSLIGPVVYFDYDLLIWRFDPLALQSHLSDAGVDAYLDKVQRGLPEAAQRLLQLLACLPVNGSTVSLLVELGCKDVPASMAAAQSVGAVIVTGDRIRFSHDRPRVSWRRGTLTPRARHTNRYPSATRPRCISGYLTFLPSPVESTTLFLSPPTTRSLPARLALTRASPSYCCSLPSAPRCRRVSTRRGGIWTQ
jgi:hypothetical protein